MSILKSKLLSQYSRVTHGFVNNLDGFDIDIFAEKQSLEKIYSLKQVHSDKVFTFENDNQYEKSFPEGDSLITREHRKGVSVFTADCVPIVIFEKKSGFVSAVHAGWRGTLKKIAAKTVSEIKNRSGLKSFEFVAAIGPAIGICCYEVDEDVAMGFTSESFENSSSIKNSGQGKYKLDLVDINRLQLLNSGVSEIDTFDICTRCNSDFPSYRRDGSRSKRMLSFIGLL